MAHDDPRLTRPSSHTFGNCNRRNAEKLSGQPSMRGAKRSPSTSGRSTRRPRCPPLAMLEEERRVGSSQMSMTRKVFPNPGRRKSRPSWKRRGQRSRRKLSTRSRTRRRRPRRVRRVSCHFSERSKGLVSNLCKISTQNVRELSFLRDNTAFGKRTCICNAGTMPRHAGGRLLNSNAATETS